MTPNIIGSTFILAETAIADGNNNKMAATPAATATTASVAAPAPRVSKKREKPADKPYEMEIVWRNVGLFVILHSMALYGLYLVFAESAYWELLPGEFGYHRAP